QLVDQVVEAQRALRKGRHVPGLEVEGVAAALAGLLPPEQPGPLAQLVADGLAGDRQIAGELALDEVRGAAAVRAEELLRQLRRPALARVEGRVGRDRQL